YFETGPKTGAANSQRTFGPLRDSDATLAGKVGANGDEVGVAEPLFQRTESDFVQRRLMAHPVLDTVTAVRGLQSGSCTRRRLCAGDTTAWGPVRNVELDFHSSFEDFRGASGNRFQFEFNWVLLEGGAGAGALGWTIDDAYFEWSESHPT